MAPMAIREANSVNTNGRHVKRHKLIRRIARRLNVRPREAQRIVNALLLELREALGAGHRVKLSEFGVFRPCISPMVLRRDGTGRIVPRKLYRIVFHPAPLFHEYLEYYHRKRKR
jgi:nucleoid DNA-binding protein